MVRGIWAQTDLEEEGAFCQAVARPALPRRWRIRPWRQTTMRTADSWGSSDSFLRICKDTFMIWDTVVRYLSINIVFHWYVMRNYLDQRNQKQWPQTPYFWHLSTLRLTLKEALTNVPCFKTYEPWLVRVISEPSTKKTRRNHTTYAGNDNESGADCWH